MENLNISEYLVRTSNLEEVFVQIGEDEKKAMQADDNNNWDTESDRKDSLLPEHSMQMKRLKRPQVKTELGASTSLRICNTYLQLNCRSRISECCVGGCMAIIFMSLALISLSIETIM